MLSTMDQERVLKHMWIAGYCASRYSDREEAESIAKFHLCIAAKYYNESRGKFSTYAMECVLNGLAQWQRKERKQRHEPLYPRFLSCRMHIIDVDHYMVGFDAEILCLLLHGYNGAEIGRKFGMTRQAVSRRIRKLREHPSFSAATK